MTRSRETADALGEEDKKLRESCSRDLGSGVHAWRKELPRARLRVIHVAFVICLFFYVQSRYIMEAA